MEDDLELIRRRKEWHLREYERLASAEAVVLEVRGQQGGKPPETQVETRSAPAEPEVEADEELPSLDGQTFAGAAVAVLSANGGRSLHYNAIYRLALERGFHQRSASSANTLRKKMSERSDLFVQEGSGYYRLQAGVRLMSATEEEEE